MKGLLLLPLVAGCATAPRPEPKGGPRGLHASEHLEAARQQDELAKQASRWPEPAPVPPGGPVDTMALPWVRSWDTADEHARMAAVHRSKAAELEAEYEDACGSRSHDEAAISPLVRYAIGGWATSTGVIVYLSQDAGPPDKLLADMKCHRAWMMLAPSLDMDDCPLDLPGLVLDAHGDHDGITVSITVHDLGLVDELHRRAAHELEAAAHRLGKVQ